MKIVHWLFTIGLLIASTTTLAQPRYGLSPQAYAVFSKWMTSSCIGDEAEVWRETLRRYRNELAPAFVRALTDGPPEAQIAAVRRAADVRYRVLASLPIDEYRIEGVDRRNLARPSRQGYADDQVQRYVTGYKSNAIAGLGIVGGPEARTVLSRFATRRGDPLAAAAAEAMKNP
jgi:hypothetical protein